VVNTVAARPSRSTRIRRGVVTAAATLVWIYLAVLLVGLAMVSGGLWSLLGLAVAALVTLLLQRMVGRSIAFLAAGAAVLAILGAVVYLA
jgi:hypothetical protein